MRLTLGDRRNLALSPSYREFGPADDPRDDHEELFTCPGCGCSYIAGGFSAAHNFSPCPGTRCERDCWKETK